MVKPIPINVKTCLSELSAASAGNPSWLHWHPARGNQALEEEIRTVSDPDPHAHYHGHENAQRIMATGSTITMTTRSIKKNTITSTVTMIMTARNMKTSMITMTMIILTARKNMQTSTRSIMKAANTIMATATMITTERNTKKSIIMDTTTVMIMGKNTRNTKRKKHKQDHAHTHGHGKECHGDHSEGDHGQHDAHEDHHHADHHENKEHSHEGYVTATTGEEVPAWKRQALEAGNDPMAAPFGGTWNAESSVNAAEGGATKMEE